jgi:hypothetical protein
MIWRISFVALLLGVILTACGDRVRGVCPEVRTKNNALGFVTSDTAAVRHGAKCL